MFLSLARFGAPTDGVQLGHAEAWGRCLGILEGSLSVTPGLTETGVFEDVYFDIPNNRAVREGLGGMLGDSRGGN